MNLVSSREVRELKEQVAQYKDHFESQNKTIWTYQKFFLTFKDELQPLLQKWKELHGADPYIIEHDPVEEIWLQRIEEVRTEEQFACKLQIEDVKLQMKGKV